MTSALPHYPNHSSNAIPVLHNVDRLDSTLLAKLDHSQTHRATSVVLKHHITSLQLSEVIEESVSNSGSVNHHRGNFCRNTLRNRDNVLLRDNQTLRPGSYTSQVSACDLPLKGLMNITASSLQAPVTPFPIFSTIPTPSLPATAGKIKLAGFLP